MAVGIGRLALAAAIGGMQLFGFGAIGVFISTLTRIPLAATLGAAGVLGLSDALESASFLTPIRPAIPSTYWDAYPSLFHAGQPLGDTVNAVAVSLTYLLVFGVAAWLNFRRADIAT